MTDLCRNRLTAAGDTVELADFVDRVRTDDQPLSFETIAPTPSDLLKEGWYEWRIQQWGTKWDAEFEDVTEPLRIRRTRATYVFVTRFRPPVAWVERARQKARSGSRIPTKTTSPSRISRAAAATISSPGV